MFRKSILLAAVACALVPISAGGRHFKLEGGPPDGVRRFVSPIKNLSLDGEKPQTWETLTRAGTFYDPRYDNFEITRDMLLQMVSNFDKGTYGQEIFIDVSHEPSKGAAAKIVKLTVEGTKLRALLEWTPYGVEAVKVRGFRYFSAEFADNFQDNERRQRHGATLIGAGLTIRPVIKGLDPADPSRLQLAVPDGTPPTMLTPELQTQFLSEIQTMWKELIKALSEKLKGLKLADAIVAQLITLAEAAVGKTTDETLAKGLIASFETAGKNLSEEIAKGSTGEGVKISLSLPDDFKTGMSEADVKKLMETMRADAANAAKKLTEETATKVKLLTDTINAAQGIDDELKKELADSVKDLVTADMTDEKVKSLAATMISMGNKQVASRTLAGQGFEVRGRILSVDDSNAIKALQENIDKRLGYEHMPAHQRYRLSDGAPLAGNKTIVEKALAQFDAEHGRRLHEEHKQMKRLAAGDSVVSDVAVPVAFERAVLRESLYQMVALGLCDVGTDTFGAVVQLPYSYRDTAGAGRGNTRTYEGGAIRRAAVKQAMEEARPIPQKLSFEVSDELRYLVGNGQINFDIVAENAQNATRIIGEDSEQLMFNEHLAAADQYSAADISNENLELQADDTKKVFVLAQWPVVRPKKVYDLQGNQVGSTLYPITVTYNSVARAEYDGTGTQADGIYYVLNYNLGEIYLVDELGAIQLPANSTAYTISYSYTSNVAKWDMDLGSLTVEKRYNDFLYRFGLRKTAVEDRSHMANVGLMSGVIRTQIEQAEQFGANFKRQGTDLMADGNLGRIKDIPSFRSYAPGLYAGDQRIVIAERGSVRFRMLKAWTMGQLENQKNSDGRYVGKKEAYGDQFIVVHTPTQLKAGFTSMVLYSAAARIARVAP